MLIKLIAEKKKEKTMANYILNSLLFQCWKQEKNSIPSFSFHPTALSLVHLFGVFVEMTDVTSK